MSLFNAFEIAGSGLSAESLRLNTVASNLSNANTVSGDPDKVYHAREPIFQTAYKDAMSMEEQGSAGVKVAGIAQSEKPAIMHYQPDHPLANKDGYVFSPDINPVEAMANMISVSRAYQNNVQVANVAKQMMLRTLELGE